MSDIAASDSPLNPLTHSNDAAAAAEHELAGEVVTSQDAESAAIAPSEDSELGFGVKPPAEGKPPLAVLDHLVAFPPNRQTLGGTSYWIETPAGNVLVDCPPWTLATQHFLGDRGVRWLFLTHRNAMAKVKMLQAELGCEVVVQEQEAYLLPEIETQTFHREGEIAPGLTAIWTPGYSPGSACLYWQSPQDGGVLFTGRHLLPTRQGGITPLRTSKTFHWPRQLKSVTALSDRFTSETLKYLCPGASIGFLRGEHKLAEAWELLQGIDLEALAQAPIGP